MANDTTGVVFFRVTKDGENVSTYRKILFINIISIRLHSHNYAQGIIGQQLQHCFWLKTGISIV